MIVVMPALAAYAVALLLDGGGKGLGRARTRSEPREGGRKRRHRASHRRLAFSCETHLWPCQAADPDGLRGLGRHLTAVVSRNTTPAKGGSATQLPLAHLTAGWARPSLRARNRQQAFSVSLDQCAQAVCFQHSVLPEPPELPERAWTGESNRYRGRESLDKLIHHI